MPTLIEKLEAADEGSRGAEGESRMMSEEPDWNRARCVRKKITWERCPSCKTRYPQSPSIEGCINMCIPCHVATFPEHETMEHELVWNESKRAWEETS